MWAFAMTRLKKKHSRKRLGPRPVADAGSLVRAQSLRSAFVAAIAAVLVVNATWVWLSTATGKFFPWVGIVQGVLVGLAVQRAGRGLDWRFPVLAALVASIGSFSGGFFVALSTTEIELGASSLRILRGLTVMTWQTYFDEVLTPVDVIYAFCAASVAAFYAKRRLKRHEEYALRTMGQDADTGGHR
jgi:hypothetical protein